MQTFSTQQKSWRELLNVANILKVLSDELRKEKEPNRSVFNKALV